VTSTPSGSRPDPQWQQPTFAPATPEEPPLEGRVYTGASASEQLVPAPAPLPPSVPETVVRTISSLIWPVLILLALMGWVGFWPAILTAVVASIVLGNLRHYLRARRRALVIEQGDGTTGEGLR